MLKRLYNILLGNEFSALEFYTEAGKDIITLITVKKKGSTLSIISSTKLNSLDELKKMGVKTPVIVVINTDKILIKGADSGEANDKKILHKAFPNIKADDFYYEIWRTGLNWNVAVGRREYINNLLDSISVLRVYGVFLGISPSSYFDELGIQNEIYSNTHLFTLPDYEYLPIAHQDKNQGETDYLINGLNVNSTAVIPFAGLLHFFMPKKTLGNCNDLNINLQNDYVQKAFFRKGISAGVAILLFLLLINFFAFSYYFDKVEEGRFTAENNENENAIIAKLQNRVKDKERQLKDFRYNAERPLAPVVNEIASGIPASILLDELSYNPLEKKIKKEESLQVSENTIIVKGVTLDNIAFTKWVEKVQEISTVESVKIISFGKRDMQTAFMIRITLRK